MTYGSYGNSTETNTSSSNTGGYGNNQYGNKKKKALPIDGKLYKSWGICFDEQTLPDSTILQKTADLAKRLDKAGVTTRIISGNPLVDDVKTLQHKELYSPWGGFGNVPKGEEDVRTIKAAKALACTYQPGLNKAPNAVWSIVGIQAHLILGAFLKEPLQFLLVYSPDNAETEAECNRDTGRITLAITLADRLNIPVFNLNKEDAFTRLESLLINLEKPSPEGNWELSMFEWTGN